jgi:Zn-dependent protease with chaperone function
MTDKTKKYFVDISPREWEHPADRAALGALKRIPGFDDIVKFFVGLTSEKAVRLIFLASSVRVSEKQFPRVYHLLEEACAVLDARETPELYITQTPVLNAGAVGVQKPFITINSGLLDSLSDDELLAVISHEVGHILSGHVLYKTLLWFLTNATLGLLNLPLGQLAVLAIIGALKEWDRKSELSADRAGLLVVQDPQVSYTTLMKLAGGRNVEQMNIDEFFKQAEEYDGSGDLLDGVYKFLNLFGQSHPFPVLRLTEIKGWAEGGAYERIVGGEFRRRTDAEEEDIRKDFDDAANQYREDWGKSQDPLTQAVHNISESVDYARKQAESFFRTILENRDRPNKGD